MKKHLIGLLILSSYFSSIKAQANPQEVYGRSFMFTRPIWLNLSTQQAIWHDIIYNKCGNQRGALQITTAYQHSIPNEAVERYFLLPCRNELLVAGDDTLDKDCRDIRAEWLNLPSNFRGKMTINPEQTQWGIIPEYSQDLCKFIDWKFLENYWISIELPIVGVTNSMNLKQYEVEPGTPDPNIQNGPSNIIEAFNQPAWLYGKIHPGKLSKIELAAIRLRMGSAFLNRDYHQIAYYTGLIFPTGSKQNAEFLFDPVTGLTGHIGFNAGVNFNITLNRNIDRYAWCFFANLDDIFMVRNDECRTLSLLDDGLNNRHQKILSRFMQFNKADCPAIQNIPGVNVLTKLVRVRPYNLIDFSMGFRLVCWDMMEVELGYDIWGHGGETIEIRAPNLFPDDFGISGPPELVDGVLMPTTASHSTIEQQAAADPFFVPITISDLDLRVAEGCGSGPTLNQKAHGSLGFMFDSECITSFCGAGWWIEFPQKNAALSTWGVWVKAGASF